MSDPIQPDPYVYSVEEVEQMEPSARAELVTRLGQYLAQINPYAPMAPNPEGREKMLGVFAELVEKQKRADKAAAWDEGIAYAVEQTLRGKNPVKRHNPYRSES